MWRRESALERLSWEPERDSLDANLRVEKEPARENLGTEHSRQKK